VLIIPEVVFGWKKQNKDLKKRFGIIPGKWIFGYARLVVDEKGYDRRIQSENLNVPALWPKQH